MGRKESEEVCVLCSPFRLSLIWVALDLISPLHLFIYLFIFKFIYFNWRLITMAMFSTEFAPHSGHPSLLLPLQA